jgi:hypothetical protein
MDHGFGSYVSAVAFGLVGNQPWFAARIYIISYSTSPPHAVVATGVQRGGKIQTFHVTSFKLAKAIHVYQHDMQHVPLSWMGRRVFR